MTFIDAMDITIMALVLLIQKKNVYQILIQVLATSLKFEPYPSDIVLRCLKHLVLACVAFCFLTV